MADLTAQQPRPGSGLHRATRVQRWVEFVLFFIGAPLAIALFLPPGGLFPALAVFTLAGLGLIWWTGDFDWRLLVRGWSRIPWAMMAGLALAVFIGGYLILWATVPGYQIDTSRRWLRFLPFILLFYPLLSALPQELIFRALYYHRYAPLMGSRIRARMVNAAIFSFAHLMYWSVIVAVLTFAGGWLFARLYERHGFPAAWVAHAIAGNVIFIVGMGYYFYSGNVVRPF